jgi:hypothetical protein
VFFAQFFPNGSYQLLQIRSGKLLWRGSYAVSGNTLVFDPDTPKKMVCGMRYNEIKNLVLSNCDYAGTWESMANIR